MKKIIILLLMPFFSSYSQEISTSTYTPRSYSETMSIPMALKQKYDENQKYLYALKKWVIELKAQIQEPTYLSRLNGEYSILTSMENEDLARASKILNQTEVEISEIVSDYKKFISKQSKQINNNQSDQIVKSSSTQKDYINDGVESYREKNFSDAILNFTKALENNPDNTEILFFRALSKSEIGDRYGAINDYDKILLFEGKVTPINYKFSTVYNNKAYCLVELGFFDEALPLVEKAIKLDETEWYIWDTRAEIYLNLGQLEKCILDCTKAIKLKANGNSYLVRGMAYIKKGEKFKGCQDLSIAGELGEEIAYEKIKENCNKK